MAATHFLTLNTPAGERVDYLNDFINLECTLVEGGVGTLVLTLPPNHDYTTYRRDARIAYYRAPSEDLSAGNWRLVGNTLWLVAGRKRRLQLTESGWVETHSLFAVHPNHLLGRRIVEADEGTAGADKSSTAADDLIKAYVRENFVSSTDTARNWASTIFAVDDDLVAAPVTSMAASYNTVLDVCQKAAAAASSAGTYTNFEIYCPIPEAGPLRLRTYTGQRGTDRSATSSQPLILRLASGDFSEAELSEDWSAMADYIYALGGGKLDERVVRPGSNASLIAESPYGRIEAVVNANSDDTTVLDEAAQRGLWDKRPRQVFTSTVTDTIEATFMDEYDWGDRVGAEFARLDDYWGFADPVQFDCRVDPVRIRVDRTLDPQTGEQVETEALDIRLRAEV